MEIYKGKYILHGMGHFTKVLEHGMGNDMAPADAAKKLAEDFDVSRQVIVQDIALIRAEGYDILATNRGYILLEDTSEKSRVFKVIHSDEETEEEFSSILDNDNESNRKNI